MWEMIAPGFSDHYQVILFDLIGHGMSDLSLYTSHKYRTLQGYASDVLDIVGDYAGDKPVVYVGHSVSAMIGMLAAIRAPGLFARQVMVSPTPSFINDGAYTGGFSREQIDGMLALLDADYLAWIEVMAPLIMGAPSDTHLTMDLSQSFRRNDPKLARNFARVVLQTDLRSELPKMPVPALILQCTRDAVAPRSVGEYMARHMAGSELVLIDNIGHCPHLSNPQDCGAAIREYLDRYRIEAAA
jgi:sigma-B regulation protein RsbQ